jgi:hypothetical protein
VLRQTITFAAANGTILWGLKSNHTVFEQFVTELFANKASSDGTDPISYF